MAKEKIDVLQVEPTERRQFNSIIKPQRAAAAAAAAREHNKPNSKSYKNKKCSISTKVHMRIARPKHFNNIRRSSYVSNFGREDKGQKEHQNERVWIA